MDENKFGKVSRISLITQCREGKTLLKDVFFTAPYKIMAPFEKQSGGISVMPLCASAGIMEGDSQEFSFYVGEGSELELLSQSFEKIHKMKKGQARRHVSVQVERDAVFYYYPQPVIPYRDSAFESIMEIKLADSSSAFFLMEIISCGRSASEERFKYRKFASKVMIYRAGRLVYCDNARYEPHKMSMEEIGLYEGFTHMANLFLTDCGKEIQEDIWQLLEQEDCEGGVTRLAQGDLAVRIMGMRAQELQEIGDKIKELFEKSQKVQ